MTIMGSHMVKPSPFPSLIAGKHSLLFIKNIMFLTSFSCLRDLKT